MFQHRNLGKAGTSLSADPAVVLVFPEDGFLSPVVGTRGDPNARVPPWILGPEPQYKGLIFFRSHKSEVSILISSKTICHRAKLTGKLEKGRERALGLENLSLCGVAPSRAQTGRKKSVVLGKAMKGKTFLQGQEAKGTFPAPYLPS